LANPADLTPEKVAFLTGYLCHLQADWLWIKEIFLPIFGPEQAWGDFKHRLYLHNVLRTYLDVQVLPGLKADTGERLVEAKPDSWLPFVDDYDLREWRDILAKQLQPDSAVQTVEVFAARQGIPAEEYYDLLNSNARMEEEVFVYYSREDLLTFRARLIRASAELIPMYLNGELERTSSGHK
jgi:hypothetical protein